MRPVLFTLLFIFFFIASCKHEKKHYKPQSIGIYSEVSVVASENNFKDYLNDALMDSTVFGQEFEGIFFPPEVKFVTKYIEPSRVNKFKGSRNLIIFEKGKPEVNFYYDSLSIPQCFVLIKGNSVNDYLNSIQQYKDSLVNSFERADQRLVVQDLLKKDHQEKDFLDSLGVKMIVPNTFKPIFRNEEFAWYRQDIIEDILNIMFYKFPQTDSLTIEKLVAVRDLYNKRYVDGAKKDDFPRTDSIIPVSIDTILNTDKKAEFVLKGNWSMEKTMLGGPFITKVIYDKNEGQLYYADTFIVAPNVDYVNNNKSKKRNYLIQLDGILSTFDKKTNENY